MAQAPMAQATMAKVEIISTYQGEHISTVTALVHGEPTRKVARRYGTKVYYAYVFSAENFAAFQQSIA